jgi:transcription elongation GreA/GreB family factor
MTINKARLIDNLLFKLEQTLLIATRAADDARDLATHEQSKPETQYDTVGLEASYLAHGQSQRVEQLKNDALLWKNVGVKSFASTESISAGALVLLENESNEKSWYLIGPAGGGLQIFQNEIMVNVVTQAAPLGSILLGKYIDDEVRLNINGITQVFDIINII